MPLNPIRFGNCYLAAPQPTLGHCQGGSLTYPMLITCVLHIRPKGHQEPCSEVGCLSPAKHLVEFELGTFQFWSQHLNINIFFCFYMDEFDKNSFWADKRGTSNSWSSNIKLSCSSSATFLDFDFILLKRPKSLKTIE